MRRSESTKLPSLLHTPRFSAGGYPLVRARARGRWICIKWDITGGGSRTILFLIAWCCCERRTGYRGSLTLVPARWINFAKGPPRAVSPAFYFKFLGPFPRSESGKRAGERRRGLILENATRCWTPPNWSLNSQLGCAASHSAAWRIIEEPLKKKGDPPYLSKIAHM